MRGAAKAVVAATTAVALVAAPAAANPIPEPEPSAAVAWLPFIAIGGLLAGIGLYVLHERRAAVRPYFAGEDVTIVLEPSRARVIGVYRFRNPGDEPRSLELRYPFARGPELGNPENVAVSGGDGEAVPFSWKRHDVAFEIEVPPRGEAAVTVSYEQICRGCEFTYILTSTRNWQRPIDEARFAIVAPVQLAPVECPYDWKEVPADEGLVRYEFGREAFYPDVDLNVRWQRPAFYFGSASLEGYADAPAAGN
jgi:hypothetical protein